MTNNNLENNSYISSLYTYNHSLFIAYLNGSINALPLPRLYPNWNVNITPYRFTLPLDKDRSPIDLQAYKHVLFFSTSQYLYSLSLKNGFDKQIVFKKEIPYCSKIRIDYKNNYLFAVSDERGLVVIDIANPYSPKFLIDICSNFKKKGYIITDMDVSNGTAFLSVRNKGIIRLDYIESERREPFIYRELEKMNLTEPQDVKYSSVNKNLYIGDANLGLIILNTENGSIRQINLPNDDIPRKIIIHYNDIIIQGKKGLYYFYAKRYEVKTVLDFKIGTMTKYYSQLIYTRKNTINLLLLGQNDINNWDNYRHNLDSFENVHFFNYATNTLTNL